MKPTGPQAETSKLPYIDLLRGIAVLMVVLVHTSQKIPGLGRLPGLLGTYGQFGVQLFFLASAYTLCRSSDRRGSEPRHLLSFYLRRIFRIAPLYYLGIAIYGVLHLVLQPVAAGGDLPPPNPYTPANILANALFVHGLVPQANNSIVPGGWSIGTEMLFYALFPALFALAKRNVNAFGFMRGLLPPVFAVFAANAAFQLAFRHSEIGIRNTGSKTKFLRLPHFWIERAAAI